MKITGLDVQLSLCDRGPERSMMIARGVTADSVASGLILGTAM